ncbi:DNA repair protein RecO [bacterium BMS3Abin02]|nr:DNA repair protein RecO [bacterium BMS3Abin02]GBE21897.1 DNA repair protein RecO [bacterium BMS3Bbin01]HDH25397.1 DNA repair protein RecO [Actinomycetota bacterium]HDL49574.1 DNA repair protein RecO [Actinomycetota bacterium]
MGLRSDQGIVLRSYAFGEADRVVVILSPNNGKLRTVAKGIRKTKSRFGGRLEPFTHVDLILYEGRNLDTITQVSVIEAFPNVRADLDRVLAAGTMVEVVDAVATEDDPSLRLFLLLQRGLRVLDRRGERPDLVTSFLLKLSDVIGFAPALDHCAGCGRGDVPLRFSLSAGGAVCTSCRPSGTIRLRPGLTNYLAGLAASDLDRLPPEDSAFCGEALGITRRFLEHHLERRLSSLAVMHE